MNVTLSIDEQLVDSARKKLQATGKTINQEIREHLRVVVGNDDGQLARNLEFLQRTAGLGDSKGWKYDREDAYEQRLSRPR